MHPKHPHSAFKHRTKVLHLIVKKYWKLERSKSWSAIFIWVDFVHIYNHTSHHNQFEYSNLTTMNLGNRVVRRTEFTFDYYLKEYLHRPSEDSVKLLAMLAMDDIGYCKNIVNVIGYRCFKVRIFIILFSFAPSLFSFSTFFMLDSLSASNLKSFYKLKTNFLSIVLFFNRLTMRPNST